MVRYDHRRQLQDVGANHYRVLQHASPLARRLKTVCLNRHNGFVLLPVVLAITLLAVIAFLLNNQRVIDLDVTAAMTEAREVEEVTQAGLAHAEWLLNTSRCQGDLVLGTVPFGPGGIDSYTGMVDAGGVTTSHYTFHPDRDTWIRGSAPDSNFGGDSTLRVSNTTGDNNHALYHFELSSIPVGSRVVSATLWLYITQYDFRSDLLIHRITKNWGEYSATWNSIGNGYETKTYNRIARQSAAGVWASVNLTALSQAWVNNPGSNHGILLSTTSNNLISIYTSREASSDIQPYLEVTTADGDISPVQVTATGSLAADALGNVTSRTITHLDIPAYQSTNTLVIQGPVLVKDTWLNSSKTSLNYGADQIVQVAESDISRSLLEFSLDELVPDSHIVSASLELYANSVSNAGNIQVHPLTTMWEEGSCNGVGCTADGGTWATRDGVNAWTTSGADYEGVSSASYYADTVNVWHHWDITGLVKEWAMGLRPNYGLLLKSDQGVGVSYTSSESTDTTHHPRLIIQFACECGSPCLMPQGAGKVLMVVDNSAAPGSADLRRKELLETWGYTVQLIGDEADQLAYDTEFGLQEVVYVSASVDPTILGSKLVDAPISVVSESGGLNASLGFSLSNSWPVGNRIDIADNSHPITELFPVGQLSIYEGAMEGLAVSSTLSPDLQSLALWGSGGTLAVLDKGAALAGGGTAAGPRVMLPFGRNLDWRLVNNSGLLLLQRALDWGIVAATETLSCDGTYRDEFNAISYSGSDGTLAWATDWLETGDSGDAASGDVMITSDLSDNRLMVKNKSRFVEREADLSSAGAATLTFDYRRSGLDDSNDRVVIQVSGDGGILWTTLEIFSGPNNDADYVTTSHDISSFIAPNTRIRFLSSSVLGKQDDVYFDNVQITCTP